ncbi:MAG: TVP38/TMEM64 family protein [Actinobacteria bacterium]|nr:TVP38/TMEM64 family protein [Actinomycetota bacterium]
MIDVEIGAQERMLHRWKLVAALAAWAAVLVAWFVYQRSSGHGPVDTAQGLVDAARGNWWAAFAYVAVSVVRPLLFFPATLVTVAAGILFGAAPGIAVAAIAANASALVGYSIGRRLRNGTTPTEATGPLARWNARLQANTFEAVLLTRLLFLPYDAVNYGCGVARVRPTPFVAATAIGTLPGTIAFVLVGASITRIDDGLAGLDRTTLATSAIIVVLSIIMSRVVRSRSAT